MSEISLTPGLYLVATPIGSARDITLRALDILQSADVIAAEDTRNTRKLMDIHGIKLGERPIIPYHDHNGAQQRPRILDAIEDGKSVAYVSDAGTPMVADPGFTLARAVIEADGPVTAAPGASAVLCALSIAGLPTDKFMFVGFPPPKTGARNQFFKDLENIPATLVFYESPKRLDKTLASMIEAFGEERQAAICRELTKKFEQALRGTLRNVLDRREDEMPLKGEIVIVLGPPVAQEISQEDLDGSLRRALLTLSVKDAAAEVAQSLGLPRKTAYNRALELNRQ